MSTTLGDTRQRARPTQPPRSGASRPDGRDEKDPLRAGVEQAQRLFRSTARLGALELARAKEHVRRKTGALAVLASAGVVGALILTLGLITSFIGASGLVAWALGTPTWVGALIVGPVSVLVVVGVAYVAIRRAAARRVAALRRRFGTSPEGGAA